MRIREYAEFSQDTYNQTSQKGRKLTFPKTKNMSGKFYSELGSSNSFSNNFFGRIYLDIRGGILHNAIIAFRGTFINNPNNIWTDITSWASDVIGDGKSDHLPSYYSAASGFVTEAKAFLQKHFPSYTGSLTLTGHSLGGALAALMPLTGVHCYPAIVFNSPGCGHLHGVHRSFASYVTNVNALYGFINKVGKRVGETYWVNIRQCEADAKKLFKRFDYSDYKRNKWLDKTFSEHSYSNLLSYSGNLAMTTDYLKELSTIHQTENYKETDLACLAKATHLSSKILCRFRSYAIATENIIMAQHSITNMIGDFTAPENQSIASRSF